MISLEKKLLNKFDENLWILIGVFFFLAGILMRIPMRYFVSIDSLGCYLPWYEEIMARGQIKSLGVQVGDYNVLYQTIISLLSYLPIEPLYLYKGLSIFFDLLTSLFVGFYIYDNNGEKNKAASVIAFSAIWIAPVVCLNSSLWAQCDMIYTFFILLSLNELRKGKYPLSFIFLGIAFAFKLQAVLILPFYFLVWFKEKKFSILHFLIVPAVMWITTIPGIIGGRSLFSGFELYVYQTDEFHWAVVNSPSIWLSLVDNFLPDFYDYIYPIAMVTTLAALAGWMIYVVNAKKELSETAWLSFALLLTYTAVFFLPSMHERYGFIYEILGIIYLFKNRKSIIPCILLQIVSVCTYSRYLFGADLSLRIIALVNIAAYVWYAKLFINELSSCPSKQEESVQAVTAEK